MATQTAAAATTDRVVKAAVLGGRDSAAFRLPGSRRDQSSRLPRRIKSHSRAMPFRAGEGEGSAVVLTWPAGRLKQERDPELEGPGGAEGFTGRRGQREVSVLGELRPCCGWGFGGGMAWG